MARPSKPLGFLQLEIELTLHRPVAAAYFSVPPRQLQLQQQQKQKQQQQHGQGQGQFRGAPSDSEGAGDGDAAESADQGGSSGGGGGGDDRKKQDEAMEELDIKALKRNIARLKRFVNDPATGSMLTSPLLFNPPSSSSSSSRTGATTDYGNGDGNEDGGGGGGDDDDDDGGDEKDSQSPPQSQGGKEPAVAWRLGLLLPLLYRACFTMRAAEAPLWLFALVALHGFLVMRHRTTQRASSSSSSSSSSNSGKTGMKKSRSGAAAAATAASSSHTAASTTNATNATNATMTMTSAGLLREEVPPEWLLVFEDELGPSTVPRGPIGKIKMLKKVMGGLQRGTGLAASALERAAHAWTWEDRVATT